MKEYQKLVLWPNIDAGNDSLSKAIRMFREKNINENFSYAINFSPDDYVLILKYASCAVGNSSSFIREGSFLGTPAVIIGDRQIGRECGNNVVFTAYDRHQIKQNVLTQLEKRIKRENLFGDGHAGEKIANKLSSIKLNFSKRMTY